MNPWPSGRRLLWCFHRGRRKQTLLIRRRRAYNTKKSWIWNLTADEETLRLHTEQAENSFSSLKLIDEHQFDWHQQQVKYLGVHLTKDMSQLYEVNYKQVNRKVYDDSDRWGLLPLDLGGRVRSLYLFTTLPVEVPLKQFREWDKHLSRFIWNNKKPRVRYTMYGGMTYHLFKITTCQLSWGLVCAGVTQHMRLDRKTLNCHLWTYLYSQYRAAPAELQMFSKAVCCFLNESMVGGGEEVSATQRDYWAGWRHRTRGTDNGLREALLPTTVYLQTEALIVLRTYELDKEDLQIHHSDPTEPSRIT